MNFERAKSWLTIIKSLAPLFKYDVERVRNLKTVDLKCAMIQDHWITWKPVFKILQINCLEDYELIRLNQLFNSLPNEKNDQDFHLY